MSLIIGPILKLRSATDTVWTISVLVGIAGSSIPSFTYENKLPLEIKRLYTLNEQNIYRFVFDVSLGETEQKITYHVNGEEKFFHVPATEQTPKIAFTSCNGFSSAKEYSRFMRNEKKENALWNHLNKKHNQTHEEDKKYPYHLLVMGGDQIYADKIWYNIFSQEDGMEKWFTLSQEERKSREFTSDMEKKTKDFYFYHYCDSWKKDHLKDALASIPTIMMWDDHDIFDGWGSYSKEDQECKIFKNIFHYARLFYKIFQHHLAEDEEPIDIPQKSSFIPNQNHFSSGYKLGNILLLTLDMRSERSQTQILSDVTWHEIYKWIDDHIKLNGQSIKHLFVVSALPLVHADFSLGEKVLPFFNKDLLDDLYDHWSSRAHQGERSRLLYRLYEIIEKNIQVSILSGDVHLATYGKIFNKNDVKKSFINQLTSSGIVHPAPAWQELLAINYCIPEEIRIDTIFCGTIGPFPQSKGEKFIPERNYLSLEPSTNKDNKDNVIWANWIVEGQEDQPYILPIHPLGKK